MSVGLLHHTPCHCRCASVVLWAGRARHPGAVNPPVPRAAARVSLGYLFLFCCGVARPGSGSLTCLLSSFQLQSISLFDCCIFSRDYSCTLEGEAGRNRSRPCRLHLESPHLMLLDWLPGGLYRTHLLAQVSWSPFIFITLVSSRLSVKIFQDQRILVNGIALCS